MQNSSLSDFYLWAPLDRGGKWTRGSKEAE